MPTFLLLVVLWLSAFGLSAAASVLLSAPPPDAKLSFNLAKNEIANLQHLLLIFASEHKLRPYHAVPRAVGKSFFLGLVRADNSVLLIAEQDTPKAPIVISCTNIDHTIRECDPLEGMIESALEKKWPHIMITRT